LVINTKAAICLIGITLFFFHDENEDQSFLIFSPFSMLVSCQKFDETEETELDPTQYRKLYHVAYGSNSRQTLDIDLYHRCAR